MPEGNLEGDALLAYEEEGQTHQPHSLEVACVSSPTRANTATHKHTAYEQRVMATTYLNVVATVGLKNTLEYLQNHLLEVSVDFRSLEIKLFLLQRTDSSSPKKTISHWSIKNLLIKEENIVIH